MPLHAMWPPVVYPLFFSFFLEQIISLYPVDSLVYMANMQTPYKKTFGPTQDLIAVR